MPNHNIDRILISGDLFVKNIMTLCDYKENSISLRGRSKRKDILPINMIYSAVEATQFVPLQKLSPSANPIVFKYGIPSTILTEKVRFRNILTFQRPNQTCTLRI